MLRGGVVMPNGELSLTYVKVAVCFPSGWSVSYRPNGVTTPATAHKIVTIIAIVLVSRTGPLTPCVLEASERRISGQYEFCSERFADVLLYIR